MPTAAASVPADHAMLCEDCGYTVDGLPPDSRCPECGKPLAESTGEQSRVRPAWEDPADPRSAPLRFLATSLAVLLRPKQFYRSFATRSHSAAAYTFALIHWGVACALFGVAAIAHWPWYMMFVRGHARMAGPIWAIAFVASLITLLLATRLASWLTAWEARYRGLRLPLPVVRRGLYYHAAHYLPVALAAVAGSVGYDVLYIRGVVSEQSYPYYFYMLAGEVILSAVYLFNTYWIGMKNMMYANR